MCSFYVLLPAKKCSYSNVLSTLKVVLLELLDRGSSSVRAVFLSRQTHLNKPWKLIVLRTWRGNMVVCVHLFSVQDLVRFF